MKNITSGDYSQKGEDVEISELEHFRKLFVGGLHSSTTENSLASFYAQFGTVVHTIVMRDHKKVSRGFGFVTFSKSSMVDEAQKNRPHVIDGKQVETKRSLPRNELHNPDASVSVRKIFVGGLKESHDEETLREHFSAFGNVIDVKIISDKVTGRKRGFGYVEFDDSDAVDKAVFTQPHTIKYVVVDVKKSVYKKNQEQQQDPNNPNVINQNPPGPYWNNWGPPPNWGPNNYSQPPPNWTGNNHNQPPPNWNWGPQPYWGWQNWGPPPNSGWTWNPQAGWVQNPPLPNNQNATDDKNPSESQETPSGSYNSAGYTGTSTSMTPYNSSSSNYATSQPPYGGPPAYGNPTGGYPYTSGPPPTSNSKLAQSPPTNSSYGNSGYNQNWNSGPGPMKNSYTNNRSNPYSGSRSYNSDPSSRNNQNSARSSNNRNY